MAEKKIFKVSDPFADELITYTYYPGFAVSQKRKSIASLHEEIKKKYEGSRVLEVSSKSPDELGIKLSAFNLMFYHEELGENRNLENVFQSSKCFEEGGPYRDLLNVHPKDAKRDERLQTSGKLLCFDLYGQKWPLEPKTLFYDYIYIKALSGHIDLLEEALSYDIFTDIEFNHKKSINCQARSLAIAVSLARKGKLEETISDINKFISIYPVEEQMSML